jgi:hypothetical protein
VVGPRFPFAFAFARIMYNVYDGLHTHYYVHVDTLSAAAFRFMNNPVSAITAFSTLGFSFVTTLLSVRIYKELVREVSADERAREQYEFRSSVFVQKRQMIDDDTVSWFTKSFVKLRSEWPLGALICGYSGDPFLRSQRLVVLWGSILIGMVLNVVFFTKPNPDCYNECPDETYTAQGDPACKEKCDEDCEGNGLLASLLAAVISIPIVGTLNVMFAWLRRPFEGDLAVKQGVVHAAIRDKDLAQQEEKANATGSKPGCCVRFCSRLSGCCQDCYTAKVTCIRATFPCCYRLDGGRASDTSKRVENELAQSGGRPGAPLHKTRTKVSRARAQTAFRRRQHEVSLEKLWTKYDPQNTGEVAETAVREMMQELNDPHPVSQFAVDFVTRTADISGTGVINRGELRLAIPLYLALQSEQQRIDRIFDRLAKRAVGGQLALNQEQVAHVLATVNDGIQPLSHELSWVIDRARAPDSHASPAVLGRDELWRAVAIWYPHVHRRRTLPPPPKKAKAMEHGRRQKCRSAMDAFERELEPLFLPNPIMSAAQLRAMMVRLNQGEAVPHDAVKFVLDVANITSPECIHSAEVKPALALYLALQDQQEHLDTKFAAMYRRTRNNRRKNHVFAARLPAH